MIRINLAPLLAERGVTPRALSRTTRLSLTTVRQIVLERTARIDLGTLNAICDALQVTPGDLLVREPGEQPPAIDRRRMRPRNAHPRSCQCYDCLYPAQRAREPRVHRCALN